MEVHQFTDAISSWSDDYYNLNGKSAPYSIISANGIDGVLTYNDGTYDQYFNVQAVMGDHIMVCGTYTGIGSVSMCSDLQAKPWYFERAIAEANYP